MRLAKVDETGAKHADLDERAGLAELLHLLRSNAARALYGVSDVAPYLSLDAQQSRKEMRRTDPLQRIVPHRVVLLLLSEDVENVVMRVKIVWRADDLRDVLRQRVVLGRKSPAVDEGCRPVELVAVEVDGDGAERHPGFPQRDVA